MGEDERLFGDWCIGFGGLDVGFNAESKEDFMDDESNGLLTMVRNFQRQINLYF